MRAIRERVARRRPKACSDEELDEIVRRRRDALLDAHDFTPEFVADLRAEGSQWNFRFGPRTLYRSSRGRTGRVLEAVRRALRPLQKLFWNPTPLVAALDRQAEINAYTLLALSDLAREVESLILEVEELRRRHPSSGEPDQGR